MNTQNTFKRFYCVVILALSLWGGFAAGLTGQEGATKENSSDITLPVDSELVAAYLNIYVNKPSGEPVNVHRIIGDWAEAEVTWDTFDESFDDAIENSFLAAEEGWHAVEVTKLVKDWMNGVPNFGLLLDQVEHVYPRTRYYSREHNTKKPFLLINYTNGGVIESLELPALGDTYIWRKRPDENFNDGNVLYTGWASATDKEKQTLLLFDVPVPTTCRTHGYWKTHSEHGPAPYDSTWAELPDGADTPFFSSGKSYYEVLWTPPKKGNAYYILARQFIAAQLNMLNGAYMPPKVVHVWNKAFKLFSHFTPEMIDKHKKNKKVRKILIKAAKILRKYNKGKFQCGA
ncbi:MAG: DNRLRE domain-containing protein [Planctomycetota bacterium]|jgi:hypothetical protein